MDFLKQGTQLVRRQITQCTESPKREETRAGEVVVVVDGTAVDADAGVLDERLDFFLEARHWGHAPRFTARTQGIADLTVLNV